MRGKKIKNTQDFDAYLAKQAQPLFADKHAHACALYASNAALRAFATSQNTPK